MRNYIEGIFLYKYAKMLEKNGHEVFIITTKKKNMPSFETFGNMKIFRVDSFTIPKLSYPVPVLPRWIKRIMQVVKKYQIDLIEFNNSKYLTCLPIFFVKKKVFQPVTVSVDGLAGITFFSGSKIVDLIGLAQTLTVGKGVMKRADGIRLSHGALIKHLVEMGIPKNKLRIIYNYVDTRKFHPGYDRKAIRRRLGVDMDDLVILFVGRIEEVKGLDYLIDAAKNLVKRYDRLRFILVGDGASIKKYQNMVTNFGNSFIFTGIRRDVAQLMNAADILVLPSLSEGCPNVVLEASSVGLPVVATAVGAVPEIILNNKTGIIVPPKDAESLEKAIQTLIENPEKAKKIGRKAREHISSHFNMKTISERVKDFYQMAVRNKKLTRDKG